MENYRDYDNDSNIIAYESGEDYILIKFKDGSKYLYTYMSAGMNNIEQMKTLAVRGDGLNAFISHNRPRYASKSN